MYVVIIIILFLQNGESALHAACMFDHVDIVKMLLSYGADANLKNSVIYDFNIFISSY